MGDGPAQGGVCNRLLSAMSPDDYALIGASLIPRSVSPGEVLIQPYERIETVYFPERGLASFVSPGDVETEVGVVGLEGIVGLSVVMGAEKGPLKAAGQIAGDGFALASDILVEAADKSRTLRTLLLRYAHVFMMQAASTVYANAHFSVEQRLARWLLMCHDRLDSDELMLTHEFLAMMLCVRRPGVTVATHVLEGNGLIRARRGRITIRDREKLSELAGDSYGIAEAEYDRIIGPRSARTEWRKTG